MTLKGNQSPSFTISLKIRPDRIREMDIASMSEHPFSDKNDRNLYMNDAGNIVARIFDGTSRTIVSSARVSSGSWSHIALTGDGRTMKLYINGILDRTLATGHAITNYSTPEFVLGQASQTRNYFAGQMVDVRLFGRTLSDNEIADLSGFNYRITSAAATGGTISPSGQIALIHGSSATFSIIPDPGYSIADVLVNNNSVGARSSYTFNNISANHTISATFRRNSVSIHSEAGAGGNISPEGTVSVDYGSNMTFTITPATGYHVYNVVTDGVSQGNVSSFTFSNVTSEHSITAEFRINTYNISVVSGTGGSVLQPGTTVQHGDDHIITIKPDDGYRIEDVVVDGKSAGRVAEYIFENVRSDHSISVSFRKLYSITASAGEGGSVSPSGTFIVPEDSVFTVQVIPGRGYRILNVVVDNKSLQDVGEYTFADVRSDHNISAFFTDKIEISVFPNPFRDYFNLKIKSPSDFSFTVYVLTLTNKIVYRNDEIRGSTLEQIFLDSKPGIYFLKVYKENKSVSTIKLIRH
jgi:hypothetical protein